METWLRPLHGTNSSAPDWGTNFWTKHLLRFADRGATAHVPDRAEKYAARVDASISVRDFLSCWECSCRCLGGCAWKPTFI